MSNFFISKLNPYPVWYSVCLIFGGVCGVVSFLQVESLNRNLDFLGERVDRVLLLAGGILFLTIGFTMIRGFIRLAFYLFQHSSEESLSAKYLLIFFHSIALVSLSGGIVEIICSLSTSLLLFVIGVFRVFFAAMIYFAASHDKALFDKKRFNN